MPCAYLADFWHGDSKDGTSRLLVAVVRRTGIATSGLDMVFGCTGFLPSKPLGCYGDGGAIFTDGRSVAQAYREMRVYRQRESYVLACVAVGCRKDTFQTALVLAKLESFELKVEKRLVVGNRYSKQMDQLGNARVQLRPDRTSVQASTLWKWTIGTCSWRP